MAQNNFIEWLPYNKSELTSSEIADMQSFEEPEEPFPKRTSAGPLDEMRFSKEFQDAE